MNSKLKSLLRPYIIRIKLNKVLTNMVIGLNITLALGLATMIYSKFMPLINLWKIIGGLCLTGVLASIVGTIIIGFDHKAIYREIDNLGFAERIQTYAEFSQVDNEIAVDQRLETEAVLAKEDLSKSIRVLPIKKHGAILLALIVLIFGTSFIQTKSTEETVDLKNYLDDKEEIEKKIEEKEEQLKDQLETDDFEILEKQLKLLKESLNNVDDLEHAEKEVLKSEKKVDELIKDKKKESLQKTLESMKDQDLKKQLEKALEDKSLKEFSKALDGLNIDQETMEKMKDILNKGLEGDLSDLKGELMKLDDLLEQFKDSSNGDHSDCQPDQPCQEGGT